MGGMVYAQTCRVLSVWLGAAGMAVAQGHTGREQSVGYAFAPIRHTTGSGCSGGNSAGAILVGPGALRERYVSAHPRFQAS